MSDKPTGQQVVESLNGFEQWAIQSVFHAPMNQIDDTMIGRALLFILKKREGMQTDDAFKFAMNLPYIEVQDHFSPVEDEQPGEAPGGDGKPPTPTS